jgi:hypothetical protein
MFNETLIQINSGATVQELNDALQQVVAAVRATGKCGAVTLTVKVAPAAKNAADVLVVESQVKARLPEPERGMTIFYATEDNRLVRNDPRQQRLDLRTVEIKPPQRGELKEVI